MSKTKTISKSSTKHGPRQASNSSKKELISAKLSGKNGATLATLIKVTGWQAHSVCAALSNLRKSGTMILCNKQTGKPSVYRIVDASGEKR